LLEVNGIYEKIERSYVPRNTDRVRYESPPRYLFQIGEGKGFYDLYTISHIDHHCSDSQLSSINASLRILKESDKNERVTMIVLVSFITLYDFFYMIYGQTNKIFTVIHVILCAVCIGSEIFFAS